MKLGYIYRMISPSLKVYIGQTINSINQRHQMYKHPETMRGQRKLKRALLKYGYDAFTVEVFEVPRSDLSLIEALIIAQEDSFENGYNGTEGGEKGHQKLDSELKYGMRPSDDPRGYRKAQCEAMRISRFGCDEPYGTVLSGITEEPTTVKEIAKKINMREQDVCTIIMLLRSRGAPIKSIGIKCGPRGGVRQGYYIPSAKENLHDAGMRVGKLTKAECPNKGNHGNYLTDEKLRERAKGTGYEARNARRLLKRRAEKRAHEC